MSDTSSLASEDAAILSTTDWEVIQLHVTRSLRCRFVSWGKTKSGGFNLIRFLKLEGPTEVVVRVPLDHVNDPESAVRNVVATMQYFQEKTNIPLPQVICHNASSESAQRPYLVTTKAEGVSLVEIWDDMSDAKRDIILRQSVQILLSMYSQRFDTMGILACGGESGLWSIVPQANQDNKVYQSGTDYWIDYANRRLKDIKESRGLAGIYGYAHVWWMRSLIPAIYDNSLDINGFPILHGDFHSQNIFIIDAESENPRISSIIDWDDTKTLCTSSFVQPPCFIIDHPLADPDDPKTQTMSRRNARDREVFKRFLQEEELKLFPNSPIKLSRAHENWEQVYLFEQCIGGGIMYSALWDQLVDCIVGDEDAHINYIGELIESGIIKHVREEMEKKESNGTEIPEE
jgi:hypothetical protein